MKHVAIPQLRVALVAALVWGAAHACAASREDAILPRPRRVSISQEWIVIDGPLVVVKQAEGAVVDYAAEQLVRDLKERVAAAASVGDTAAAMRAKFVIVLTQRPSEPEGFVATSKQDRGRLVYTVAGHDPRGILYGAFAVEQAIEAATVDAGQPAAPAELSIEDAPAMATRLLPTQFYSLSANDPKRAQKLAILDWVARWRLNGVWRSVDGSEAQLAAMAREARRRGIDLYGVLGFRGLCNAIPRAKGIGLCPSNPEDLARVRGLFEKAARAGCTGFAFLFDDLSKKVYMHHAHCPRCKGRFRSTSEWQLAFIKVMVDVARERGVEKLVVCPTPYQQGKLDSFPDARYFETLCGADFMKDVLMFHCDCYTDNIRQLERRGLRNYIWWNNGLWTSSHYFDGAYMGLPRLFHIWYGFEKSLGGVPEPKPIALESLKRLGEVTRHVYPAPTGSFGGKALGGSLAWSPRWTVEHEQAVRRRVVEDLFGRQAWPAYSEWESNMLAWYAEVRSHRISFDKAKAEAHIRAAEQALAQLTAARKAAQGVDAPLRCAQAHAASRLDLMRRTIAQAKDSLKVPEMPPPVDVANDDDVAAPKDVLLWLRFSRVYDGGFADYSAKRVRAAFHGPEPRLKQGVFDNAVFLDGKKNYLEIPAQAAGHLNPGKGSFSLECWVFMMGHGWNQFVGKRGTTREIYRSIGYAIGSDRVGNRWRFTIEDDAGRRVSLTAGMKRPLHNWHHLAAVRDAAARQVRFYVDGRLAQIKPDTTGNVANTHPLRLGWDRWSGARFWGFLDEVRLWNRALTDDEVRGHYAAGRAAMETAN